MVIIAVTTLHIHYNIRRTTCLQSKSRTKFNLDFHPQDSSIDNLQVQTNILHNIDKHISLSMYTNLLFVCIIFTQHYLYYILSIGLSCHS